MRKKIIGIFVCLLLIATVLPTSGTVLIDKSARLENNIKVNCQLASFNGVKRIEKNIPKTSYFRIIELANEIQTLMKSDLSLNELQEKLNILINELKTSELLPKNINVDSLVDSILERLVYQNPNPIDDNINYMNFIVGVGQDSIAYCLRGDLLGVFVLTPLWILTNILYNRGILDQEYLFSFGDMADILQWRRPRAAFMFGDWWSPSGSLNTIGLNGIYSSGDSSPVGLFLVGFIGIAVTSDDNNIDDGFILGFSLKSRFTK